MKQNHSKPATAIASVLLFITGIMLSCNVFAAKRFVIGSTGPGGGIVFHVTDDGQRGLEAAPSDLGNFSWDGSELAMETNAGKFGLFDGSFNTDRIVSTLGSGVYAALECANYSGGGYGDWYMPSRDELNLMWENLADSDGDGFNNGPTDPGNLGGFDTGLAYWSSTEFNASGAYAREFFVGTENGSGKSIVRRVRAVRAF